MTDVTLRGLATNGRALLLDDGTGHELRLELDDELFSAVSQARAALLGGHEQGAALRPRNFQAMIRSGMTAREVADATGTPLDHVQQYERPVLAERAHIAGRAGQTLVYPENEYDEDPRPLEDLVSERLSLREVDTDTMRWDAWKALDGGWRVQLTFTAADKPRTALWDYSRGGITALDDEARWLSDNGPTDSGPIPAFGSPVDHGAGYPAQPTAPPADPVPDADVPGEPTEPIPDPDDQAQTGRILDSLRRRRGQHDQGAPAGVPESGGPTAGDADIPPARLHSVPAEPMTAPDGAHTALSRPEDADDDGIFPLPGRGETDTGDVDPDRLREESGDEPERPAQDGTGSDEDENHPSLLDEPGVGTPDTERELAHSKRKRRSSVPSWDEIMFGSKRD